MRCIDGQSDESTWAKAIYVARFMVEGRLRIPADMPGIELFTKQIRHMTSDELAMLHGTIRSMFLALMSTEERASNHAGSDWPTVF